MKVIKKYLSINNRQTAYTVMVVAFVVLSLMMNITAVISVPVVPIEGLGLTKLNGTPYTFIDMTWALPLAAFMMVVASVISEVFSRKQVIQAIILGYLGGLALSVWLLIGQLLAGGYSGNNFALVIDGELVAHFFPWDALGQSWRFLLAGFIAYMAANVVNTGTIWFLKRKDGNDKKLGKRLWLSSLLAQIVDDFFFIGLAFIPIGISALEKNFTEILFQAGLAVVLEIILEAIVLPFSIKLAKKLKTLPEKSHEYSS